MASRSIATLPLNDGKGSKGSIPVFGLGTFLSETGEVATAVEAAIRAGYRHIDGAQRYNNEAEVGQGITACIEAGVVKRENLFLTSKLNNSVKPADIKAAVQKTLSDWQTDYIDLFLIHHPVVVEMVDGKNRPRRGVSICDQWSVLEQLVQEGLIKHIGVSNFRLQLLNELLNSCTIRPVCNQIERHPYLQQNVAVEWMKQEGIQVVAYGPLGAPGLSKDLGPDHGKQVPALLKNPTILAISEKQKLTPAQVLLAWGMQTGTVVIPKSVKESRIQENLASVDAKLNDDDMQELAKLEKGEECRYFQQDWTGLPIFE